MTKMLVDAAMLGMLGCIDTLLTAVIADSLTRTEHDSNKELIGQGIGNLVSGTELEFVIMVIAVSCVKLLSAHNSTQHTSRKHKV
jgi:Sulfate permease and related transporters (MFS superfamily)